MKGVVKGVSPRMKDGVQRSWTGANGTLWYFHVTIEDEHGKMHTGEVAGKTEGAYRFGEGDEVEFTEEVGQYGNKLKLDRPKDGSAPNSSYGGAKAKYEPPASKQASGWSPEKENSVMIQGLLKSIIEGGIASKDWEAALNTALTLHDKVLAARVPKTVEAVTKDPAIPYHRDGHPDARPVHQGVIGGSGIGDESEEAPF